MPSVRMRQAGSHYGKFDVLPSATPTPNNNAPTYACRYPVTGAPGGTARMFAHQTITCPSSNTRYPDAMKQAYYC
jgi:hypothetical protein